MRGKSGAAVLEELDERAERDVSRERPYGDDDGQMLTPEESAELAKRHEEIMAGNFIPMEAFFAEFGMSLEDEEEDHENDGGDEA